MSAGRFWFVPGVDGGKRPLGKPLPPPLIIAKALKFKCSKCSNSTLVEKVYRLHVKVMM
jgi:hypothetical protein